MKRSALVSGAITAVVATTLGVAPPAQAAPERFSVQLVDDQNFLGIPGTFTSNIPGCETGRSHDVRAMVSAGDTFHGTRLFVCDSGAGTFTVNLSARFDESGSVGTWSLVAATGAYGGVRGAGKLVGTPLDEGIRDTYTGIVTVIG